MKRKDIPMLNVLTESELEQIHQGSLQVLEKAGIRVMSDKALKFISSVGVKVDFEAKKVYFPPDYVANALKSAPAEFTLYGRGENASEIRLGDGDSVYTTSGFGSPSFIDLETGVKRQATKKDLADLMRLHESCLTDIVMNEVTPQDAENMALTDLECPLIVWDNTHKHYLFEAFSAEHLHAILEMAAIVAGSEAELKKRPIVSLQLSAVSPLVMPPEVAEGLIEGAKSGIPIGYWTLCQAGASSPLTLAGTLVQQNAEVLAGLVLAQLSRPGAAFMYGSYCAPLDLRTGVFASGSPETALMTAATAQLCRHYRLPFLAAAGTTESILMDAQNGYERAVGILLAMLSGANIVHGAVSAWQESVLAASPAQVLISNEITEMIYRVLQGVNVSAETLAVDTIIELGPGPQVDHLSQPLSRDLYAAERWQPRLGNRRNRMMWESKGSPSIADTAKERAREMLAKAQGGLLSPRQKEALTAILCQAQQAASTPAG
ncbi:MAG: trimethylamine methyltransferase family protein [Bacillota bacterium]